MEDDAWSDDTVEIIVDSNDATSALTDAPSNTNGAIASSSQLRITIKHDDKKGETWHGYPIHEAEDEVWTGYPGNNGQPEGSSQPRKFYGNNPTGLTPGSVLHVQLPICAPSTGYMAKEAI